MTVVLWCRQAMGDMFTVHGVTHVSTIKRAVLLLLGMCLETTIIMAIKEELRIDVAMALIRSRNDFAACREIANATLVVDLQYISTDLQKDLPPLLLLRTYIVLGKAAALPIPCSLNNPAGLFFLCVGR